MKKSLFYLLAIILSLTSCAPQNTPYQFISTITPPAPTSTPYTSRPEYKPGELVEYIAQNGDNIPALAARFNTTSKEILEANPIIPHDVSTLPPGMPMQIPIYYLPLWGTQFKIIPDGAFVNGPDAVDFEIESFVDAYPGWLREYEDYVGTKRRNGAEIVQYVAENFSINPRLLLALLEYQAGGLTQSKQPDTNFILGYEDPIHYSGTYLQLVWAANTLNNGYYGWRKGTLLEFDRTDGHLERPDPWQNAGTVALQYYFSRTQAGGRYETAIGAAGLLETYTKLFGDPWEDEKTLIPGSLTQPELQLPFPRAQTWTYTGAPHTGWGKGTPFAAVDFAPPSNHRGCFKADEKNYVTAMAMGMVTRVEHGVVILDLDLDGDERTGWSIFYLHIATNGRAKLGSILNAGEAIGYPSCEGGTSTGTHIHIARKYNGEWIIADSPLPFNMEGWVPREGDEAYTGTLSKNGYTITASAVSDSSSRITSGAD